jgi:hypothetical protein
MSCGEPEQYKYTNNGLIGRTAWECPRCHKVNAPHVDKCDCVPTGINEPVSIPYFPYQPYPLIPGYPPIYPYPNYGEIIITCKSTNTTKDE